MKNKIIAITGQTATGKTALAVDFAKKLNGELINCDSRQIYKYLNIITGKDFHMIGSIRVWLYDIVDPKEYFSSFDYKQLALAAIEVIFKRGKTPIIVGGTYLYLHHLLYGIETAGIGPDWELRNKLEKMSVEELQDTLRNFSRHLYDALNPSDVKNPRRLMRKIEIAKFKKELHKHHSGKRVQRAHPESGQDVRRPQARLTMDDVKIIGLRFKNKDDLTKAIEKRVLERVRRGAFEEVAKLLTKGYKKTDPGLQTIGYQHIIPFIKGKITKEQAIKDWITKEVQYARRQYQFMRKNPNIEWREV